MSQMNEKDRVSCIFQIFLSIFHNIREEIYSILQDELTNTMVLQPSAIIFIKLLLFQLWSALSNVMLTVSIVEGICSDCVSSDFWQRATEDERIPSWFCLHIEAEMFGQIARFDRTDYSSLPYNNIFTK